MARSTAAPVTTPCAPAPAANYLSAGSGDDTLDFRVGFAEAYGGPGKDIIYANNGLGTENYSDEVYGGSGDATIYARDGKRYYIDCGAFASPTSPNPDTDSVQADSTANGDPVTDLLVDCENKLQ